MTATADACALVTAERADLRFVADEILMDAFASDGAAVQLCVAVAQLGARLHRRCALDFTAPIADDPSLSDLVARATARGEDIAVSLLIRGAAADELLDLIGGLVAWSLESLAGVDAEEGYGLGDAVLREVCAQLAV